jgi:hypothetical protein
MKKKIIFLDFDGVVNAFREPDSLRYLSKRCVSNLNILLEKTGAYVVITSAWKVFHPLSDLRQVLVNAGLKFPDRIIGKTPNSDRTLTWRGQEIKQWIKEFPGELEAFVILDDNSDMEPYMDRLVKTNPVWGLGSRDVRKALKLLGGESEKPRRPDKR